MSVPRCTECGATLTESGGCLALFHELLALEAQVGGAPGNVPHFLAVATYNLQHPSTFTSQALAGLRRAVSDVLDGRATIADVRRRATASVGGAARVKRHAGEESVDAARSSRIAWPTQWPMTVLAVSRVAPEQYVEHVTRWARGTVQTLDEALGAVTGASE